MEQIKIEIKPSLFSQIKERLDGLNQDELGSLEAFMYKVLDHSKIEQEAPTNDTPSLYEQIKLRVPKLTNYEIKKVLARIYELRDPKERNRGI